MALSGKLKMHIFFIVFHSFFMAVNVRVCIHRDMHYVLAHMENSFPTDPSLKMEILELSGPTKDIRILCF